MEGISRGSEKDILLGLAMRGSDSDILRGNLIPSEKDTLRCRVAEGIHIQHKHNHKTSSFFFK